MPLRDEDKAALKAWFSERCRAHHCPGCGSAAAWALDSSLSGMLDLGDGGNVDIANATVNAFIPIVCANCGFTEFYAASVIGVAPRAV